VREPMVNTRAPIGELLVQAGYIDSLQVQAGMAHQRRWGGRLGEALVHLGFVTEEVVLAHVARQHGVPYVCIGSRSVDASVVGLVPEKLIRARKVFPIACAPKPARGLLVVATSDPWDLPILDEVAFVTGKMVKAALASDRDIEQAIERYFHPRTMSSKSVARLDPAVPVVGYPGRAALPTRAA